MTVARDQLAIAEITATLTTNFDLPTMLSTVVHDARRGFAAASAVVAVLDDRHRAGEAGMQVVAEALREPTDADLSFISDGPGLDSARDGSITMIADLAEASDTRWPRYRHEALRAGMRGMRAFPVTVLGVPMGALVIHTDDPWGLQRPNDLGQVLANLTALALSIAPNAGTRRTTADDLIESLMEGTTTIAAAIGIVAQTLGGTVDDARIRLHRLARAHGVTVSSMLPRFWPRTTTTLPPTCPSTKCLPGQSNLGPRPPSVLLADEYSPQRSNSLLEGKPVTASDDFPPADDIRAAMADLAANFATHTELTHILESITTQAVRLIDSVHFADILLIDEDGHRSLAPTAPVTTELDTVQVELFEGPCMEAATNQPLVHSADLAREERWPNFAAAALAAGIRSMMSFHLYTHSGKTRGGIKGHGALNLFSHNTHSFTLSDQAVGAMLATHAATTIIAANRQIQFESALNSRDLFGQAKGILMERFKVDAVRAFNLMTKLSQDTNTPVRVIAQRIIDNP